MPLSEKALNVVIMAQTCASCSSQLKRNDASELEIKLNWLWNYINIEVLPITMTYRNVFWVLKNMKPKTDCCKISNILVKNLKPWIYWLYTYYLNSLKRKQSLKLQFNKFKIFVSEYVDLRKYSRICIWGMINYRTTPFICWWAGINEWQPIANTVAIYNKHCKRNIRTGACQLIPRI